MAAARPVLGGTLRSPRPFRPRSAEIHLTRPSASLLTASAPVSILPVGPNPYPKAVRAESLPKRRLAYPLSLSLRIRLGSRPGLAAAIFQVSRSFAIRAGFDLAPRTFTFAGYYLLR